MGMNNPDFAFVCLAAIRYSLGRRTYAPKLVTDFCKANRRRISTEDWNKIRKEVGEAIQLDSQNRAYCSLGHDSDRQTWKDFLQWIEDTFPETIEEKTRS